jgi:2-(1,2-epoxy-1,2-dihydrophenyl)acetyl-CoA isomerase
MSELASYFRTGAVGHIKLRSPATGNALSVVMAQQLLEAVQKLRNDIGARAVLIEAEGRNFCVGGDLSAFAGSPSDVASTIATITGAFHTALELLLAEQRPIVGAVQGAAAGAGMALAVIGDVVVASEHAQFTPAFVAVGLSADGGTTWLLPRLIGTRRTCELLLLNRHLNAATAEAWGLVSYVYPTDQLNERALQMATQLANGPTSALATIKRLVRQSHRTGFAEQTAQEARAIAAHAIGSDGLEGVMAFFEKRSPKFSGVGA